MFNLAFDMAILPARLLWRGTRSWWRRRQERKAQQRWQPMARPLGNVTPPVPRVPGLTAKAWAALIAASSPETGSKEALAAAQAQLTADIIAAMGGPGRTPAGEGAAGSGGAGGASGAGGAPGAGANGAEDDGTPELARFHSREGDGFKIIFHFQLKRQRVRRAVWLDFIRLARRMGRDKAWAMRARMGHSQMRYAVDRPSQPWGRVELPEVRLAIDSTRSQKARSFMLDTLDAVNAMIDAGGIDLVSGRFKVLPAGDGVFEPAAVSAARPRGAEKARKEAGEDGKPGGPPCEPVQGALALPVPEGGTVEPPPMPAVLPQPGEENAGLPRGVVPEHVCTGILAGAGVTERSDSTGRHYRIFYADVDVDGRIHRQTGADLERALKAAGAYVGMRVRLQHLGHVPVNGGRLRRKVWNATVLPG